MQGEALHALAAEKVQLIAVADDGGTVQLLADLHAQCITGQAPAALQRFALHAHGPLLARALHGHAALRTPVLQCQRACGRRAEAPAILGLPR